MITLNNSNNPRLSGTATILSHYTRKGNPSNPNNPLNNPLNIPNNPLTSPLNNPLNSPLNNPLNNPNNPLNNPDNPDIFYGYCSP